jgi:hypothetical protein
MHNIKATERRIKLYIQSFFEITLGGDFQLRISEILEKEWRWYGRLTGWQNSLSSEMEIARKQYNTTLHWKRVPHKSRLKYVAIYSY